METYNEKKILQLLRAETTKRKAFEAIVEHYQQKLYWQIRRMVVLHEDANDILQNTFVKAWVNIHQFRGDAKLSTWLYRIAMNECLTFLNQQRSRLCQSLEEFDQTLLDRLESDSYFCGDELEKRFYQAILSLPNKQQMIFNMKYFDDITYNEMSEILGTTVGALKASYHHAVKKIEKVLRQD